MQSKLYNIYEVSFWLAASRNSKQSIWTKQPIWTKQLRKRATLLVLVIHVYFNDARGKNTILSFLQNMVW